MDRSKLNAWLLRRHRVYPHEAGSALFTGLRVRLTLWYCAVLGIALVLFGIALYLSTQYFLLSPLERDAQQHAQACASPSPGGLDPSCQNPFSHRGEPPDTTPDHDMPSFIRIEQVLYFNSDGSLVAGQNTQDLPSAFLSNTLVKHVLATGQDGSGIVDAGGETGKIYRYVVAIPGGGHSGYVGAVLVGESINEQEKALSQLLILLLSLGGVTLLGSAVGGLFLANRALIPARLAWSNQQRFIADASHELRTPLTLLRADAEVLLRGRQRLDASDADLLEDIVTEANHMSTIATNLLTLARLDSGTIHREHEIVNLAELATEGLRRVQAFAEQQELSLQREKVEDAYVVGDSTLLRQAVLVLLDNAIKYNRPGGSITVSTTMDADARLVVSDTGIGISAEHLARLGERFYRVDKARSREAGGTGLGLSIVRSIAESYGGTISLVSVPEQGTTVTLILPLASKTRILYNKQEGKSLASF